jgi:hypothetical protein
LKISYLFLLWVLQVVAVLLLPKDFNAISILSPTQILDQNQLK